MVTVAESACPVPMPPAHRSGYQEFVDLFMVITVGIATVVVLFRVAFTYFPVAMSKAAGLEPPAAATTTSTPSPRATNGTRANRTRTAAGSETNLNASSSTSKASTAASNTTTTLKRHPSVKERLETEIRALLPRRSTYYALPFFSDTVVNKHEFIESLLDLGDDALDGWLLVKKGAQRSRHWKKRYVVLDANGRIKYYPNADTARRSINIKGSLAVHAVKPADPLEFGANTLEVRGTLGGTYFFRAEDDVAARKWLCVMTKRAIQSRVPGRIDSTLSSVFDASTGETALNGTSSATDATAAQPTAPLKSHALDVLVADMSYAKESSLRQFYVVIKFKSELHDHTNVAVGQTTPKQCDKGAIAWHETLAWQFHDHACSDCDECQAIGSTSGRFCGLPDIMVVHVYEIHLRYLTTKIGEMAISLRELFGFTGMQDAQLTCAWPVTSPADTILGNLVLTVKYAVNSAAGASVTPFLVSSAHERELLGEFELDARISSPQAFFDLFYANGQSDKWADYYKQRGDSELEFGAWEPSKEFGGQVRVLRCRSLTNASIGPSSTMTTTTQHIALSADALNADVESFVLESRVFLHDIPYGDCFHVETVTMIERSGSGAGLIAKVYMGIPFSKGCMFKSKIISATKEGVQSSTKLLFECLNKAIDAPSSSSSNDVNTQVPPAVVTPFLISKEEERSPLGEYTLHPKLESAMQFFDLFYADKTLHRWRGYNQVGGDTEHDISDWQDVGPEDGGGQIRTVKFRAQSNSSLGPPSTTATRTEHVPFSSSDRNNNNVDMDHLLLEGRMQLHDVPYGDHFSIETVYEITKERDGSLVARAFIGVPFSKSTMFKSKIASATKDGVVKSTQMLFDELYKATELEFAGGEQGNGESNCNGESTALVSPRASSLSPQAQSQQQQRRPVLARYNSNLDGSVALEEIFENQRVSIFGKWGPNHLLLTDRERFTNRSGDVELSFEQIALPPHWIWTSPWKIDTNYTECDDDGWSYATDFPRFKLHLARGKSSMKRLGASVRRRRWIRMMCFVPPESSSNGDATIETHSHFHVQALKPSQAAASIQYKQRQTMLSTVTRCLLVAFVLATAALQSTVVVADQPASLQQRRAEMRARILQAQSAKVAAFEQREKDFFSGKRRK